MEERRVLEAAKAWHTACGDGVGADEAVDALFVAIGVLNHAEANGPRTLEELSVNARDGIDAAQRPRIGGLIDWDAEVERPSADVIFKLGWRALRRQRNVGDVAMTQYESVLRHHGLDVDDWRSR